MNTEPNITIGASVSAVLFALIGILRASGVVISDDLANSIEALIYALCAFPVIATALARFFVWSPESVQDVTQASYQQGLHDAQPSETTPPPVRPSVKPTDGVARKTSVGRG